MITGCLEWTDPMMKLVEELCGVGDLISDGDEPRRVEYSLRRYQEIMPSGLPVPGMHRVEGRVDFAEPVAPPEWIGSSLSLKLQDGRTIGITLVDESGRILSEGHGPSRCQCC
jgi:hypothetical protein